MVKLSFERGWGCATKDVALGVPQQGRRATGGWGLHVAGGKRFFDGNERGGGRGRAIAEHTRILADDVMPKGISQMTHGGHFVVNYLQPQPQSNDVAHSLCLFWNTD